MRELEGAPLDVAAAATGAAVALGVVGGVTAALTRLLKKVVVPEEGIDLDDMEPLSGDDAVERPS